MAHSSRANLREYFNGTHSRPDFHMFQMQAEANSVVLVGNDALRYACEADLMLKIVSALESNVPVVYGRFNLHFYEVDGGLFDRPLETRTSPLPLKNATGLNVVYMYYPQAADGQRTNRTRSSLWLCGSGLVQISLDVKIVFIVFL